MWSFKYAAFDRRSAVECKSIHLGKTDSGMDVGHAEVEADHIMMIAPR